MHPGGKSDERSENQSQQKTIVYHPQALEELIEAAQFYESRCEGLGDKFLDSIEAGLNFIQENPLVFPADKRGRRKYIIKKFPYLLIYRVREESIFILAVAHGKRKPGYWKSRDI
jgi:toxin ParE1/3/4